MKTFVDIIERHKISKVDFGFCSVDNLAKNSSDSDSAKFRNLALRLTFFNFTLKKMCPAANARACCTTTTKISIIL